MKQYQIQIFRHSTRSVDTKTVKGTSEHDALMKLKEAIIGSYIVLGIKRS
jgi:hypothetical protein